MSNVTDATDQALAQVAQSIATERAAAKAQSDADAETIRTLQGQHAGDVQAIAELTGALTDAEQTITQLQARIAELEGDGGGDPEPTTTLLGSSMSRWAHPGQLDYCRCYNAGDVDDAVRNHGAVRVSLSFDDDPKDPNVVVSRLRAIKQRYPDLLVDYAHENEADRHRAAGDIPAWARECKAIGDAIHAAFPDGDVLNGADFTAAHIRDGLSERFMAELRRIGCKLDVFGYSAYPAGRKQTPPVETPMSEHIDVGVDLAAKYGVERVAIWEIGTPLSTRYDRPTLVAKWAPHFVEYAKGKGLVPVGVIYWDSGDPKGVDNRWQNDAPKTQTAFLASLG